MADIKNVPGLDRFVAASQATAGNTQTALEIHKAMDAQDEAINMAKIAVSSGGEAVQAKIAIESGFKAATDAKVNAIGVAYGSDFTQQGSDANYWIREMKDNEHKQYEALDAVLEAQSKTLLNDPLGFISAQFTLPADIATHNYYNERKTAARDNLNNIISASDAAVIGAKRSEQLTSTELAIAAGKEAAAATNLNLAKLTLEAAGTRIKGLGELQALNTQQASLAFQMHQSLNSDASLALQRESHNAVMADRKLRTDALKEQLDDAEAMRLVYNTGARRIGKPLINSAVDWKRQSQLLAKNPEFMDILGQGQQILAMEGFSTGIPVAASSGHAALLYGSGGINLQVNPVGQFLFSRLEAVKANPLVPKDRESLASAITTDATNVAKSQMAKIDDNLPNIYAAPSVGVMLKSQAVKTPFVTETILPMYETDPKVKLSDNAIFGKAFEYAGTSPANFNLAVEGITAYYKQAVLENTKINQYAENGLPIPTKYNVLISGKIVDATNPVDVKKAIMFNQLKQRGYLDKPGLFTFVP